MEKYKLSVKFGINSVGAPRKVKGSILKNCSIPLKRLFIRFTERGFFMKAKREFSNRSVGRCENKNKSNKE